MQENILREEKWEENRMNNERIQQGGRSNILSPCLSFYPHSFVLSTNIY